jgi:hypothetical protein
MRHRSALLIALCLLSGATAAQTLYRWTDERGVVNYGDTPPRGAKDVRPVTSGQVNVVPAVPKQQIEAVRSRDEQRRREQAQQDAADEKARQQSEQAAFTLPPTEVSEVYWPDADYYPWPIHVRPPPVSRPPARPRPLPATPPLGQPPLPLGQPSILPR